MPGTRPFPVLGASLVIAVFLPTILAAQGVKVTPDGGSATAPAQSSGLTVTFNVDNQSGQQQDFGLMCRRTGAVSSCSVWPAVLPLDPGEDADVDVTYSTGSPGSGTVTLTASDIDEDDGYYNVTVENPPPAKYAPVLSTAIHNGFYRDVSMCVHGCFDAMVAHTTPAYVSMDVERAVTLVYSSAMAKPVGLVRVKATDNSEVAPDKMSIRLKRNGQWVSFIPNDSTEHFFEADSNSNYLAAAFDASDDSTGAYDDTVYVTSHWPGDTTETSSAPVRVLIVNEINSEFGAGWTLAGLQRVHFAPDSAIVIMEGDGSIAHFPLDSCVGGPNAHCTYDSPDGDFSDLMYWAHYPYYPAYVRTYPDGTRLEYDETGLLRRARDRFGNTAAYYSYSSGRLSSIVGPVSDTIAFYYGDDGKLDSIQDPGGRTTIVTINGSGDLTTIVDPDGVTALTATYMDHQMLMRTDRRGGVWNFRYDFAGKLAADSLPTIAADGDSVEPVVTFKSPEVYILANPGKGTSGSPAPRRGEAWVYGYAKNPRGYETQYALQRLWAPARIRDPLGQYMTFWRNSHGQVYRLATPSGDTIAYTWSGPNLTQVKDEYTGRTVNYEYETMYNEVTHVYGHVLETWYYWSSGTLDSTMVGPDSLVAEFDFDSNGRLTGTTDTGGHDSFYIRTAPVWQNLDTIVTAGYRRTRYEYDDWGRVITETDPLGRESHIEYDSLNRVLRTISPQSDTTSFEYDPLYLRKMTDALGNVYEITTNALGWVEERKDPWGRSDSYTYDVNGNVKTWTNRNGQMVSFTYNELDQMVSRIADGDTTTFAYDQPGRFVVASNAESVDTVRFDVSGRPDTLITWRAGTRYALHSTYNENDQRTMLVRTAPSPDTIEYRYDGYLQLDTLIDIDGGSTRILYNDDRLPYHITLPTGLMSSMTYPSTHQTSKISYSDSTVNALLGLGFAFDSVMAVKERHNPAGDTLITYLYDPDGQLTWFSKYYNESPDCEDDPDDGQVCDAPEGQLPVLARRIYEYDALGNRDTMSTYDGQGWTYSYAQIDTANRMTEFGEFKMEYDFAGNLTRKYMAADSTEFNQHLDWNSLGQLEMVETNGDTVWFGYDGFGRRVTKITESDTTRYIWDGDDLFMELDESGNIVTEYTYYPGIDAPHSIRRSDSVYYYAMDNHPGSVIGLIDESNTVVNHYEYWPFGKLLSATEGVTNNLQFAAREVDETGYVYMRSRYYDCDVGRFISEDPSGLAGGINLYAYVGNNPINFRDPLGMFRVGEYDCEYVGHAWYEGELLPVILCEYVGSGSDEPPVAGVGESQDDAGQQAPNCVGGLANPDCRDWVRASISFLRTHPDARCQAIGNYAKSLWDKGWIHYVREVPREGGKVVLGLANAPERGHITITDAAFEGIYPAAVAEGDTIWSTRLLNNAIAHEVTHVKDPLFSHETVTERGYLCEERDRN